MKTEYESAFSVPRSSIVMGSSTSPLPCFQKLKTLLLTCFTCFKDWKNAAYRCTCLHALENCCLHALIKIWTLSTISAVHQEVKLRKETESAKIRKKSQKPASGSKTQIPTSSFFWEGNAREVLAKAAMKLNRAGAQQTVSSRWCPMPRRLGGARWTPLDVWAWRRLRREGKTHENS